MAKILSGKEVAEALVEKARTGSEKLKEQGVEPCLAIVRCGEDPSDLAYERGAVKRCEAAGVKVVKRLFPAEVAKDELEAEIMSLNNDSSVHGVLLFRPLPKQLKSSEYEICDTLAAGKDVDGMTSMSYAGIMTGRRIGFPPCTPCACVEILDHYGIELEGARVALIGRSLVVGRPLAMMLTSRHATVSICHTRTKDVAEIIRNSDIIITTAGKAGSLKTKNLRAGQTVIDVSINYDPSKNDGKGGIVGDAVFDEAEAVVAAITPVPGGVGSVTSSVLALHVVQAAEKMKH